MKIFRKLFIFLTKLVKNQNQIPNQNKKESRMFTKMNLECLFSMMVCNADIVSFNIRHEFYLGVINLLLHPIPNNYDTGLRNDKIVWSNQLLVMMQ